MFSSILKEVTGYFDKRALISAFFPGMIFWGLTIALVLLRQKGWAGALHDWKETEVTGQAILLIAFFVWVAFWSFLTLNFHSSLLRLYEGHWPVAFLSTLGRRRWRRRWDDLDARDKALDRAESVLDGERSQFTSLRESLETLPTEAVPLDIATIARKLELGLSNLKERVDELDRRARGEQQSEENAARLASTSDGASPAQGRFKWDEVINASAEEFAGELARLGADARKKWLVYSKYRNLDHPDLEIQSQWTRCHERLDEVTGRLAEMVEGLWGEVEEKRLGLNQEFFLVYSTQRDDVMPTRLGNVLKASEARVWLRYNLDAWLVWSRLQPLLPKEAAEQIQDAKTSLDMMLTLSMGVLLFGLPVSVWMALQTGKWFIWLVPLSLLLLAAAARLYVAAVPAAAAVVIALLLRAARYPAWGEFLAAADVTLTCFAGLSLLSWVCYQNAVQACLVYVEKIQSAFDLYRWKVLEELHLQLPPDFKEEREIWKALGGLLYRGYDPPPEYYSYVKDEKKTKPSLPAAATTTALPVPARALPPYRLIAEEDIVEVEISEERVPTDAASTREQLVNQKPLTGLPAREPVPLSLLTTAGQLEGHVAVGVEAAPADIVGGRLRPGDRVDIIITASGVVTAKFENILVLGAPPATAPDASLAAPDASLHVVVVAMPLAKYEEFATKKEGGKPTLALKL